MKLKRENWTWNCLRWTRDYVFLEKGLTEFYLQYGCNSHMSRIVLQLKDLVLKKPNKVYNRLPSFC